MPVVILPASKAYHEETVDEFWAAMVLNDDIYDWLQEHCPNGWDHHDLNYDECHMEITDPNIAMLFKLTWGGL